MKKLGVIALIFVAYQALLMAGLIGWLAGTGRLSRDRFVAVRDVFKTTVAQQRETEAQAQRVAAEAQAHAERVAYLERVSDSGPVALDDRLRAERQANEMATQRVQKLYREIEDLKAHLELAKTELVRRKDELDRQRELFEQRIAAEVALRQDADFQQTVELYEKLKPKQAKAMLLELIGEADAARALIDSAQTTREREERQAAAHEKNRRVIDLLSAMQQRAAAAILREFKEPQELAIATRLLEDLRARGTDLLPNRGPMADAGN